MEKNCNKTQSLTAQNATLLWSVVCVLALTSENANEMQKDAEVATTKYPVVMVTEALEQHLTPKGRSL